MHDPKLIEAMAREITTVRILPIEWAYLIPEATAALTALCTLRPDVAAVLRGEGLKQELADLIHDNTTLMDSLNAAETALDTAREDALREAANLCMPDGSDGLVPHPAAARAAILALIPQPTITEET